MSRPWRESRFHDAVADDAREGGEVWVGDGDLAGYVDGKGKKAGGDVGVWQGRSNVGDVEGQGGVGDVVGPEAIVTGLVRPEYCYCGDQF